MRVLNVKWFGSASLKHTRRIRGVLLLLWCCVVVLEIAILQRAQNEIRRSSDDDKDDFDYHNCWRFVICVRQVVR